MSSNNFVKVTGEGERDEICPSLRPDQTGFTKGVKRRKRHSTQVFRQKFPTIFL
jgi:hypothetical protein